MIHFYIKPSYRVEFGDKLYAFIRTDSLNYHFHLALGGVHSFSDISDSILSEYETASSYAPKRSRYQARIIAPPLSRDITPKTKELLRAEVATRVSNTAPMSRKKERVNPRQSNSYVGVQSVVKTDFDQDGFADVEDLRREIIDASKRQEFLVSYYGMICMVFNRLFGKSDSMYGSEGEKDKKKRVIDPDVDNVGRKLRRTQGLKHMTAVLDAQSQHFRPSLIQFSKEYLKKNARSLSSIYETQDPKIPGMCELLVYWKVGGAKETVSSSSVQLSEFFIPCQSGKGDGSISIKSRVKGSVLYDYFISKVCCCFY